MNILKSLARICDSRSRVSLPEVNRLVKFESYEEFHGARVYPPYVTMTKIGLLFILGFIPGDLYYHGHTRAFYVIAVLRVLATIFSALIIVTTTHPYFRRCRVRAALILGVISLFFLVSGYILYDPRIYFVSFSWVYYQIATLMLSPLLSVRFYLSIHIPAVIAITIAMRVAGVRNDDIGIFVLFTLPALVYLSIMLKVFARKAEETYRLAYQNHLHMTLDSLSRLLNRRTWYQECAVCYETQAKENRPVSFIMLDIDHFKTINDTWGHACGDTVIRAVSDVILARTRDNDIAGRLGGEEFGIVLPGTAVAEAAEIAERIRAGVADNTIEYAGERIRVTISIGVVVNTEKEKDLSSLISSGNRFLYTAKEQGRNRVVAAIQ